MIQLNFDQELKARLNKKFYKIKVTQYRFIDPSEKPNW